MALRIALLGPPGAGKGTQAQRLASYFDLAHMATGDMLRDAVSKNTELGKTAQRYMQRGELVPNEVIIALMREKIQAKRDGEGFILDGFPRTYEQAEALDAMLEEMGMILDSVVYIEVPESELMKRLSGRRICESCGASFHIHFNPPPGSGICEYCQGRIRQRPDDAEETVKRRLQVYDEDTKPVVNHYCGKGMLQRVDGSASIDEVAAQIKQMLLSIGARR